MTRHIIRLILIAGILAGAFGGPASAQETTTYTYDAKGRVTGVTRSGGPSNGVSTTYTYDPADNRSNVSVTGSQGSSPSGGGDGATANSASFVVVPLLGGTLIFIH